MSGNASRKDNDLLLTLINPKHDTAMKVNCALLGASASSAHAQLLYHPDYNACNTFDQPNIIVPKEHTVSVAGGRLTMDLPAMSIATATVRLSS